MHTRYTARWVLPVTSAAIEHGALLVDPQGRIAAIGADEVVPWPAEARHVELGEAALLPGLVNVHAHPELTAFRGLLEDRPFHEWIPSLMSAKRGASLSAEDYAISARWGCLEALRAGITTVAVTEDSDASLDALLALGMRGVVFREVFGPSPEQAAEAAGTLLSRVAAMRARETGLVRVGVSPHAPYTVSDDLFRATARFARLERLPIAIHTAESEAETMLVTLGAGPFADGLRARGIATPIRAESTVALLEQTGLLAERPLLIHCVRVSATDIRRIAAAGAAVAHCPAANARLGHGIAPVLELREAGVGVGIGTDSVAANNRMDLIEECRVAQMLQRAAGKNPTALAPTDLLRMATLEGARALGLDDRIGSLEIGKDADLCAIALTGIHVRPVHEPLAAVFLAARASDVIMTAICGRIRFLAGEIAPPEPGPRAALNDIASRLRAALHASAQPAAS